MKNEVEDMVIAVMIDLAAVAIFVVIISTTGCGADHSCDGGGCTSVNNTVQGDNIGGDGTNGNPQTPPVIVPTVIPPVIVPVITP